MFLPHFDALCDLLLNERMEIWHLFALYNKVKNKFLIDNVCLCDSNIWSSIYWIAKKQTTTDFQFQNLSQLLESRPLPTLANTKKKKRCNLLPIQNKVISLVAMRSNELWLVQKNHGTITKSNSFSWNENLQRKRSKDGAVMRALVSHQWVPCSIPGPGVICGLGLLLAVFSALRGFSPGSLVFLSPQQFQF